MIWGNVVGLPGNTNCRVNTVLISMQKKCRALIAETDGRPKFDPFPSLVMGLTQRELNYAEAQRSRWLKQDVNSSQFLVWILCLKMSSTKLVLKRLVCIG